MILVPLCLSVIMIWASSRNGLEHSDRASARARSETRLRVESPERSVAVLPCVGSGSEPAYLIDGTTDALITALGSFRELRVISRQSVLQFRQRPLETHRASRALQVDHLVDCRVVRTLDRFRIDAQVIAADPAHEPWVGSFDAAIQDLSDLPARVAEAIATRVLERQASDPGKPGRKIPAIDPEAYEQFLRGRFLEHRFDEESVRIAESAYRSSLEIDPTFADAWVGLAEMLIFKFQFHGGGGEARAEASSAVDRALAVDPDHAGALSAKAQLLADGLAWRTAEETVRRAIEVAPSSSAARRRYWILLACQRRGPEALEQILAALRLDPLSARISGNVGFQYWSMGDHERAVEHLSRSLKLDPNYTPAHAFLYGVYSELEQEPQRSAELRKYLAGMGLSEVLPQFESALERRGFEEARRSIALLLAGQSEVVRTRMGVVAGLLAESRETDRALRILEESLDRGSWEMIWTAASPDYRNLHGHPRFHRIIQRLGLPDPVPESRS
jgi:TolB-like protein/Tfp pilus assembly protein PilF